MSRSSKVAPEAAAPEVATLETQTVGAAVEERGVQPEERAAVADQSSQAVLESVLESELAARRSQVRELQAEVALMLEAQADVAQERAREPRHGRAPALVAGHADAPRGRAGPG